MSCYISILVLSRRLSGTIHYDILLYQYSTAEPPIVSDNTLWCLVISVFYRRAADCQWQYTKMSCYISILPPSRRLSVTIHYDVLLYQYSSAEPPIVSDNTLWCLVISVFYRWAADCQGQCTKMSCYISILALSRRLSGTIHYDVLLYQYSSAEPPIVSDNTLWCLVISVF